MKFLYYLAILSLVVAATSAKAAKHKLSSTGHAAARNGHHGAHGKILKNSQICEGKVDENTYHPTQCTKYISCSNQIAYEMPCGDCNPHLPHTCIDGKLVFTLDAGNPKYGQCVGADETECRAGEDPTTESQTPEPTTEHPTEGTTTEETITDPGTTIEPTTEQPTEAPTTDPPTEAPTTEQPTEAPTTDPPTEAPTTEQPTEAPTTDPPTEAPTTEQPTEAPTTEQPTEAPTTDPPTEAPTTEQPTEAPTTEQPTEAPTTDPPTEAPTTEQPTEGPTTEGTTENPEIPPPQAGDDCDPDRCENIGNCQSYLRCDKEAGKLVLEECGQDLVWNPHGDGEIHGGNCDVWENLDAETEKKYRSDPDCLACFWRELGECRQEYEYQAPGLSNRNVQKLSCADGLVFSLAKETCRRPEDVDGCSSEPEGKKRKH